MLKRFTAVFITVCILLGIPVLNVSAKGANLIPSNEAAMNDVSSWKAFEGGKVEKGLVGSENVLVASDLGKKTWHSPAYDIYDIIRTDVLKKGGGRYQISFSIALQVTGDEEQEITTLVRATNKTAIFDMPNNENDEFRKKLSTVFGKNGEWKDYSITLGIRPEDVANEGEQWLFCFDKIPEAVTGMYIDDFSVSYYSNDSQQTVLMHSCMPSKKFATQATPVPRVTPSTVGSKTEVGKNLLDEKTSTLENVTAPGQTKWSTFSAVGLSISDGGYSGSCLRATNHSATWASPCIDIFPYITEAGTYAFSAMMKVTGGTDGTDYSFVVRGTRETSFIPKRGNNFFGNIATAKVKKGEWTRFVGQFTVMEADLSEKDTWNLCVSTVPLDVEELCLDEVVLIKGTEKQLPQVKEPDADVIVNTEGTDKYTVGELYKPELKKTIMTTSVITVAFVVLIIAGRIFLPKLIKKGQKK